MEHYESESVYPSREPSGNEREKLKIESGSVLLVDQFFLVNQAVTPEAEGSSQATSPADFLKRTSGLLISLTPGTYSIYRDPVRRIILVYPEGRSIDLRPLPPGASEREAEDHSGSAEGQTRISLERVLLDAQSRDPRGTVLVETRALALIDQAFLDDAVQRGRYTELFRSGDRKEARDYLRSIGGAVRYGFDRGADTMSVYALFDGNVLLLKA